LLTLIQGYVAHRYVFTPANSTLRSHSAEAAWSSSAAGDGVVRHRQLGDRGWIKRTAF